MKHTITITDVEDSNGSGMSTLTININPEPRNEDEPTLASLATIVAFMSAKEFVEKLIIQEDDAVFEP